MTVGTIVCTLQVGRVGVSESLNLFSVNWFLRQRPKELPPKSSDQRQSKLHLRRSVHCVVEMGQHRQVTSWLGLQRRSHALAHSLGGPSSSQRSRGFMSPSETVNSHSWINPGWSLTPEER